MHDFDAILAEAKLAKPTGPKRNAKWTAVYPVYQTLRGNEFTCDGALDWMIEKGLVQKRDKQKALQAFWATNHRRKNKRPSA